MERMTVSRPAEIKLAAGDAMTFSGYGAVFGNVDSYGDVIAPGAFAKTIAAFKSGARAWPAMLLQHGGFGAAEDLTPIGVWTDFAEDGIGLRVEGRLADTPRGQEAYALMRMEPRPAINGLSIGYSTIKFSSPRNSDAGGRLLEELDLFEVSLVTFPANSRARVSSVKSFTLREFEAGLREQFGLSRTEAAAVADRGFKGIAARDAGCPDADGVTMEQLTELLRTVKGLS